MMGLERINGKTKTFMQIATAVTAIVLVTLWFEARYAKAADVKAMQQDVGKVVTVLTINYITRKTVLELKKANGGLTAAETVELKSIYEILATLEK